MPAPASSIDPLPASARTIQFAGRTWHVKSGCGMGPGPNCWSDSAESVRVEHGNLHLQIRQIDDVWHSAEVYTSECASYGTYRFYLIGRPDLYDKNVVLGMFLYKDDDHEIDVEFAKWGDKNPPTNSQYAVQPWDKPGNREQFLMTLDGTHSTHTIDWRASEVQFGSLHGHYEEPPSDGYVIHRWSYKGQDIPREEECLAVRINLWLFGGNPPSDGQEASIVVSAPPAKTLHLPLVLSN